MVGRIVGPLLKQIAGNLSLSLSASRAAVTRRNRYLLNRSPVR
jgi:hypothetical protein